MPERPDNIFGAGRMFTRSRLRDEIGPSKPTFHLLDRLAFRDVVFVFDDFEKTLDTAFWTATNSAGAGVANFARVTSAVGGQIQGNPGTADDSDVRLFSTSNAIFLGNRRPVAIARYSSLTEAGGKTEFGFADAVVAGQVLVKATPTSTGADYAVAIHDSDQNTALDLVADGTTDAIQALTSVPALTFADATFYTVMVAIDELRTCRLWIDSVYRGSTARGPDATVALGLWLYKQARDDVNNDTMNVDYVAAWQNRAAAGTDLSDV